jgi:hypothetical protein
MRFSLRWSLFAITIIGMDLAAVAWAVKARSWKMGGSGGGPLTASWAVYGKYDGSAVREVSNYLTGTRSVVVIRPATPLGLCRVWGPVVASVGLTLLALKVARTDAGRRFIEALRPPRMTTRRWMITVAVLGIELGLVISTLKSSGVDPVYALWVPIMAALVALHTLAFMPVGIALLYRHAVSQHGLRRADAAHPPIENR